MSSHYLKMLASKSRERDPGAGWKHKGVSRRSTIAFPSEGGCSHPKAATVYPEKQWKWRKLLEKVMRKQLSWRWSSYDPMFPIPWLSSASNMEDTRWLQEGGAAAATLTEYRDLIGVALVLWSLIFSLLSAALSPHLVCIGSCCHIFPFQQHFQQQATNYLLPKTLSPSYPLCQGNHKKINLQQAKMELQCLVRGRGSVPGAQGG